MTSAMLTAGLVLALLGAATDLRAEPATCHATLSADAAREVFDRLRERPGADGCFLADVSTEQAEMRVRWTLRGESLPDALITPVDCALAPTAAGDTLALTAPTTLAAACPAAVAAMADAVHALRMPTVSLPHAYPRWLAVASWAGIALALLGALAVAIAALGRDTGGSEGLPPVS